jgi:hypothetical protein
MDDFFLNLINSLIAQVAAMEAAIEQLLEWTTSIGVELNGIHPKALHGRGIGIVATRHLEVRSSTRLFE